MKQSVCLLLFFFGLLACQKSEPTSWSTLNNAPILKSSIFITDFVADSLLVSENGRLFLKTERTLFDLTFDSLFNLPADSTTKVFSIPVLGLTLPGGAMLLSETEIVTITNTDIQLRKGVIREGRLKVSASNTLGSALLFTYRVPGATRDREVLEVDIEIPAAVNGVAGRVDIAIDLARYQVDLRGESGNAYNTLETKFTLSTPASAGGVFVTNSDLVSLTAVYTDLFLSSAEGYFGNQTANFDDESIAIDAFKNVSVTMINLEAAEAELTISNGFGVDVTATIASLALENSRTGNSLGLTGPLINNPFNLSRAIRSGNDVVTYQNSILMNEQNSNITNMISVLPDSIRYNGSIQLNPLGNISNFNDFMMESSRLKGTVGLRVPLRFSVENLLLRDTVELSLAADAVFPEKGTLYVQATNHFPINTTMRLLALDAAGNELAFNEYLQVDASANINPGWAAIPGNGSSTLLIYQFPTGAIESLLGNDHIIIEVQFDSEGYPETIEILEDQSINVFISSQMQWPVEVR